MVRAKSAASWFAEIAVRAYGSVAAHSPERNFRRGPSSAQPLTTLRDSATVKESTF
jgi:hypothetical protein